MDVAGPSEVADTAVATDDGASEQSSDATQPTDAASPADTAPASDTASADAAACPAQVVCVDTFPFVHQGNTKALGASQLSGYSCKPGADESGPEQLYRVVVPAAGFLSVAVTDDAATDVDVHLLSGPTASQCLDRGDHHARIDVQPGTYWIAVDTFVSAAASVSGNSGPALVRWSHQPGGYQRVMLVLTY